MKKILFSWSGGKDSAFALSELRRGKDFEIVALLTTVTEGYDRISMHGVREVLLQRQAAALGLKLEKVLIPQKSSNDLYEKRMGKTLEQYKKNGVSAVAFGDIYLEDLKRYREDKLEAVGMQALFPIWKRDTAKLSREFIAAGFKAVVTCVDGNIKGMDGRFAGAAFDKDFLSSLPPGIDPCGENGEFHSFVYDGPGFSAPVEFVRGQTVLRDERFYYHDLVPVGVRS